MTDKRIFERSEGAAAKFWEVWRDGSSVFTRFGRVGAGGQTAVKDEGSDDAAARAIEDEVRKKIGQGYVEAGGAPPAAEGAIDDGELRRRIATLERPEDHAVFADWLQSHGQPWGELVSLQCSFATATDKNRASLDRAIASLLATHGPALLGPAASHPGSRFEWHLGFVRVATLGARAEREAIVDALEAFATLPIAQLATGIILHPLPTSFDTKRDWDASSENIVEPWGDLGALAKLVPERVTHLGFGGWPAPAASAYVRMPSFTAIGEAFPRLHHLELTGAAHEAPGTLDLPELVALDVRHAYASQEDLDALARSTLPKLERISVWLGGLSYCVLDSIYSDGDYPDPFDAHDLEELEVPDVTSTIDEEAITGFLAALPPTVKHLGIRSSALGADLVGWLAAHPRLQQLESLDLSGGTLDDAAAKALAAAKKAFAHLKVLDVERNRIKAAARKKLAAALPNARVEDQRKEAQPELFARYVAVME